MSAPAHPSLDVRSAHPDVGPSRDADLRVATRATVAELWPDGKLIDELRIFRGRARVDVALLSADGLHGFELKSDVDSLSRLATQAPLYSRVFDTMTLVCATRHLAAAARRVPGWWGIWTIDSAIGKAVTVRDAKPNPAPDPTAWAGLLWRSEMLSLLDARRLEPEAPRATRGLLIEQLADSLHLQDLRDSVRQIMLSRDSKAN